MKSWLSVMSADNWSICREVGLLGLSKRGARSFRVVSAGDEIVLYVNKQSVSHHTPRVEALRALITCTGPLQRLAVSPWSSRGREPFLDALPILVDRDIDVPARNLMTQLSFAQGLRHWGGALQNTPVALTTADRALIAEAIRDGGPVRAQPGPV